MNANSWLRRTHLILLIAAMLTTVHGGIDPAHASHGGPWHTTARLSVDSKGIAGNDQSGGATLSADGQFIAFSSAASNLVGRENLITGRCSGCDTNNVQDVFVVRQPSGRIERVSVASDGSQANAPSRLPRISADGRYVAFISDATNLVSNDSNGVADVFVHDRKTGQTSRVSLATDGTESNKAALDEGTPAISGDGRYVAFVSEASNLVAADTNRASDVFLHDRSTGQTSRVSVTVSGGEPNFHSGRPSISDDGRYLAFDSYATNMDPKDPNRYGLFDADVFVLDRQTGQVTTVNVDSNGIYDDCMAGDPALSADGRYVAFTSCGANLAPGDVNADEADVFLHDRATGETSRISVQTVVPSDSSFGASVSAGGRYITYRSLTHQYSATHDQTFVHDRQLRQSFLVSVTIAGTLGNGISVDPEISSDGRFITFTSASTNLVPGDTNGTFDVFLAERTPLPKSPGIEPTSVTAQKAILVAPLGGTVEAGETIDYRIAITVSGGARSQATDIVVLDRPTNGTIAVMGMTPGLAGCTAANLTGPGCRFSALGRGTHLLDVRLTVQSDCASAGNKAEVSWAGVPVFVANPSNADADFSVIGCRLAFVSDRDGGRPEVYVMNLDGSNPIRVTNNAVFDYEPDWAPDGTRLVYSQGYLHIVNADGTNDMMIPGPDGGPERGLEGYEPSWSPDGTRIAFMRRSPGTSLDIFTVAPDGTGLTQLTSNGGIPDVSPTWSPDGSKIAFVSGRDGVDNIYVMNADGSGLFRLLPNPDPQGAAPTNPRWSPDGTRIAFGQLGDIFVVNSDGSNLVNLTKIRETTCPVAGGCSSFHPTWSPDNTRIAFASLRSGSRVLWIMNADGSNPVRVNGSVNGDEWPSWQKRR